MKIDRQRRAYLGISLLFLFTLYQLINMIATSGVHSPGEWGHDEFSINQERFDCLRDTLSSYDQAGYTDDHGWFKAQYELAPTILTQGYDQEVVVANFHDEQHPKKTQVDKKLELLLDCDQGVALYRGTTR